MDVTVLDFDGVTLLLADVLDVLETVEDFLLLDVEVLLLLDTKDDVPEAVVDLLLLDEVVENTFDTLDELETMDVEETALLLLEAMDERRYISNRLPAPQYS